MEQNNKPLSQLGKKLKEELDNNPQNIEDVYSDEVYEEVGETLYRTGNTILALNCFNKAVSLNPLNQKAKAYADMIRGVLDFYHKDLLNP